LVGDDAAISSTPPNPRREAIGKHLHDLIEGRAGKLPIGPSPAKVIEQGLFVPVLGGDLSNHLLGQHVQGLVGDPDAVKLSRPRRHEQCGTLGQVVAG